MNWLFDSGEEVQHRFFFKMATIAAFLDSDRNDFNYFGLQVAPIPPTEFRVSWPPGSGEEVQNRFFEMKVMEAILDFGSKQFKLFFDLLVTQCLQKR